MKRARRGQSLVETALCLLVVIPVVLGLIAFAEIGFATLKLNEAGYAALFELPALQTHDLLSPVSPSSPRHQWNVLAQRGSLAATSAAFSTRYRTLRGFDGELGSPTVLLAVDAVSVRCTEVPAARALFQPDDAQLSSLARLYGPAGSAAQCRAQADVRLTGLPDFTVSLFGEPLFRSRALRLCASGRAGSQCALSPPLLTDTWAFTGKTENLSCRVGSCDNPAVRELADDALNGARPFPGGTATMALARRLGANVPAPSPNASFAGSEYGFLDGTSPSHGDDEWAPTPFSAHGSQQSYLSRKQGYPGVELRSAAAGLSP